ncbi:hypothetical protein GCK72_022665 [Caenorhabditis remanei]|uniref:Uncharacterized protein n=1 Tax=Caenorhabditis remanei TaxID=31234 RepID=A0A6A5FUH4_CAERE|nr:hypothetical protein GCK72_022665 [Caenorhabditis remanei]KAF1746212.1 hypothetical protein GCK72_022665 [Caenorhabditis remanei]
MNVAGIAQLVRLPATERRSEDRTPHMANKASAGGIVMVWITAAKGIRLGMVIGWTIDSKGSAPSFRSPGAGPS